MRKGEDFSSYQARILEKAQKLLEAASALDLTIAEFEEVCDTAKLLAEDRKL